MKNPCLPMRSLRAMRTSSCKTLRFVPSTSGSVKKNTTRPAKNGRIWRLFQRATPVSLDPGVRAWVLALYYADGMSEPKILDFLQTVGMSISAGQLSDMLIKDQGQFHAESAAVVKAGLASSPWQHLDSTGTRVNGKNEQCHILCNPLYTAYCTLPAKDRLSLLRVLQGGADPVFQVNALALELLPQLGVSEKWCRTLPTLLSHAQTYTENQLDDVLY